MQMCKNDFRGKCKKTGKWIYGFYAANGIDVYARSYILSSIFTEKSDKYLFQMQGEEVYPATVGQYTGIKDVNDVKIYEDDIVVDIRYGKIGHVMFLLQESGWVISWKYTDSRLGHRHRTGTGGYGKDYTLKVIGNAHDNPEYVTQLMSYD